MIKKLLNIYKYFKECIDQLKTPDSSAGVVTEFSVNYQNKKDDITTQLIICRLLKLSLTVFQEKDVNFDGNRVKAKLITDNLGHPTSYILGNNIVDFNTINRDLNIDMIENKKAKILFFDEVFGQYSQIWFQIPCVDGSLPPEEKMMQARV